VRRFIFALAALGGAALLTAAPTLAANDDSNYLPNPDMTPGAVLKVDADKVCAPGYSVAPLSDKKKEDALARYGMSRNPGNDVIDYLVPVSLGGSDDVDNLWPQPPSGEFGADKKDQVEAKLHDMVCAKQIKLGDAQKAIRKDWVKAYRQYVGGEATAKK
jgi:hypothetical protein